MTKDKFSDMCISVLIPQIGDLLHQHLSDVPDTLETIARELIRIDRRLSEIEKTRSGDDRSTAA
jgi:hypothetical protein